MRKFGLLASICLVILLSSVALAVTYTATITATESSGNTYTDTGFSVLVNNSFLATNGYMRSDGLDVNVTDSGTAVPSMIVDDRTMFVTDLAASTSKSLGYTMGNTAAAAMQIVSGESGYITTADNAALEPSTDFSFNIRGGFDVSGDAAAPPIISKRGVTSGASTVTEAIRLQTAEAGVVVAERYGAGDITTDVDNYTAIPSGGTNNLWGPNWVGQTFTATVGYRISSVFISVNSITGNPGPMTLAIRATSGNLPTGPNLASATLTEAQLTGGAATKEFYIPPIALTGGVQYAFVLSAPQSTAVGNRYNMDNAGGSTYAGGRLTTSADSGATWAGVANDLLFKVNYAVYATATGVTQADHLYTVEQVSATPIFAIYVDGVLKGSIASGTAVPDNANSWVWAGQPYYDYIKLNVGVPEVLHYEPNTIIVGTALPDLDATQNGVFTFGSNPSGVTVTMGQTFTPAGASVATANIQPGTPGTIGNSPGTNVFGYTGGTTGLNPDGTDNLIGAGLVSGIAQGLSMPNSANPSYVPPNVTSQWLWRVIFLVIDLAALVLASRFGSIMLMGGVGLGLLYWQCSIGIYDWWVLIVFVLMASTFWVMQRASP